VTVATLPSAPPPPAFLPPTPAPRLPGATDDRAVRPHPIRARLISRIRAEIAAGTYITAEKLDIALDRMIESLLVEETMRDSA
jgi:hypothetical protein